MQLYLYDMPKAVSKVLQKGWYPFGTYKSPKAGKLVIIEDTILTWVYQQEGLPQMTVNCIVGMNGIGKIQKEIEDGFEQIKIRNNTDPKVLLWHNLSNYIASTMAILYI